MSHELEVNDVAKVIMSLEELEDLIKSMRGTVGTAADIGNMDLMIGNLSELLLKVNMLDDPLAGAENTIRTYKENLINQANVFARNNEDTSL